MTNDLTHEQQRFLVKIDYAFQDIALFVNALTHRSVHKSQNYERLEFLGDAILSVVIAEALYHDYPKEQEGKLTRMRATLVRQETLAKVAKDLELGKLLHLGQGERKAGGQHRVSILSDVVEALIGAIYLDSGDFSRVQQLVLTWFAPYLDSIDELMVLKDPKSQLQEWLQSKQRPLPVYELLQIDGKAPHQVFHVSCLIDDAPTQKAQGKSRRIAEQNAAKLVLAELKQHIP